MLWKIFHIKIIFLFFITITVSSILLYSTAYWRSVTDVFQPGCPVHHPHLATGLKPKHTNIVFVKTHKTASSTMQNLLFRFAERNNLTVALPVEACEHQFCYPHSFKPDFVDSHTLPPNIAASHMRFNKAELKRLMPNDTIYITILREPSSMFESLFVYCYNSCRSFKRVLNHSLETFLEEPWSFYNPDEDDSMYARNTLTFDLGGDKDHPETDKMYAQAFVDEIERVFSLVMIAEYFDESLVLLRHLLSWDVDDMVYFKLNMRTPDSKQSMEPRFHERIRSWNYLDAHLYDHFNASLWRKLAALGPDCVAREVHLLQKVQEKLMRNCFGGKMPLLKSATQIKDNNLLPWQPSGKVDIYGYDFKVNLTHGSSSEEQLRCMRLVMPEVQYTNALRSARAFP